MRIAQLAPLVESVPPPGYGGSELIVSLLTEELVKKGHEVTLFAAGDSKTTAKLEVCAPAAFRRSEIPVRRWPAYDVIAITKMLKQKDRFDVIHNHLGYLCLPFLHQFDCAVVSTNHNPIAPYCAEIYLDNCHLPYVAISDAYAKLNYPDRLNYVARIYNGIDLDCYEAKNWSKKNYLLFLGRIGQAKGTSEAIAIAHAVGLPLKIAGKLDDADRDYFERFVKPHVDGKRIELLGEVSFEKKIDLLHGAIAVVYPIQFEEPFGLVMVEALASGVPLIALKRGSVSEILVDSECAVVGSSIEELIDRFNEVFEISPQKCVQRARLFDKKSMANNYEGLYRKLLDKGSGTTKSAPPAVPDSLVSRGKGK